MTATMLRLKNIKSIPLVFIIVGVAISLVGALGDHPARMWQIYLVNFLFWTGIAQAAIVFSAILEITNARWGVRMRQVADSLVYFLPISLLLLKLMLLGTDHIFPWVSRIEISETKRIYLNLTFLFGRNFIGIGVITFVSLLYVKKRRSENKTDNILKRKLAISILLLYAVVYTIIAYDFIMSLSPRWHSAIMGMHYFIACFYGTLALLLVLAVLGKRRFFPVDFMSGADFYRLGKFVFSLSVFWMSLLWAQFLVAWYGNIPNETEFLYLRLHEQPWKALSWSVIALTFFVPAMGLFKKKWKSNPYIVGTVGLLILLGLYVHFYVLIGPSLNPRHFYLGFPELAITLGFGGLFMLALDIRLRKVPIK